MNKLKEAFLATTITATALTAGAALDSTNVVEASPVEQINQGIYDIPSNCTTYGVGYPVSISAERALVAVGYTGIKVDGEISNLKEQGAVLGAQEDLKDMDLLDESTKICGYAGSITFAAVKLMQNPSSLAGESQIDQSNSGAFPNNSNPEKAANYTLDDCNDYENWDEETIMGVQRALGVVADGDFGNKSCNAMINFQERNGIAQYGKGFLGRRTLLALGIENPKAENNRAATVNGVVEGCEAKYDVEYVFCADTGSGQETGYFYRRNSDGTQTLLKSDEITSSQIDSDGPVRFVDGKLVGDKDSITKEGHFLPSFAQQRSFSLGLKNFISFNGNQGLHYYPDVYVSADSHGCLRLNNSMSDFIYNAVVNYPSRSNSSVDNFEVIVK